MTQINLAIKKKKKKNRITDIENRIVVPKGEDRGRMHWEFVISR